MSETEIAPHQFDRVMEVLWAIANPPSMQGREDRVASIAQALVPNDPRSFTPSQAIAYSFEIAEQWVLEAERCAKTTAMKTDDIRQIAEELRAASTLLGGIDTNARAPSMDDSRAARAAIYRALTILGADDQP